MYLTSSILQKHFGECGYFVLFEDNVFYLTFNQDHVEIMKESVKTYGGALAGSSRVAWLSEFIILLLPNAIKIMKNRRTAAFPIINLNDPEFFTKLERVIGDFTHTTDSTISPEPTLLDNR